VLNFHVAVPYFETLKSQQGWERTPGSKHGYYVVRLHYYFKQRKARGKLYSGEPLADISSTPGVLREDQETWSGELERTDIVSTAQSVVIELECASKLASEISSHLGIAIAGASLDGKTVAELTSRYRQEARQEIATSSSTRQKVTWSYSMKLTVDGSKSSGPVYVYSNYHRRTYDVYLAFFDYLFIEFEKRHLWERRRGIKYPAIPANSRKWQKRPNVSPVLNIPLKTMTFWELVEMRPGIVQGEYSPEVDDPFEVQIEDLDGEGPTYAFPVPRKTGSLYRYSNYAFRRMRDRFDDLEEESEASRP